MDNQQEEEFVLELLKNYQEAELISKKFNSIIANIRENFRKNILEKLNNKIGEKYKIKNGSNINNEFSQIWIYPNSIDNPKVYFGIESFSGSGHFGGNLFIGIFNRMADSKSEDLLDLNFNFISTFWVHVNEFGEYKKELINLANKTLLINLYSNKAYQEELSDFIVNQAQEFILANESFLERIKK